jgi:hypothetical protein
MVPKKRILAILWEKSKINFILVAILFLSAIYIAYVAISSSLQLEMEIALCGLVIAIVTIVVSEFQNVTYQHKVEQILSKLNNTPEPDSLPKDDFTLSSKAEGLILIIKGIDTIYKKDS